MRGIGIAIAILAGCSSDGGRLATWTVLSEQLKGPPKPDGAFAEPAPPPGVPLPPPPPFDVGAPADRVVSIGRGDHHACAVRASGAVDCWGQTRYCERSPCGEVVADPTVRRVPDLADATTISAD